MPRYFFHLQSDHVEVPDERGREFAGIHDAHLHAQMIVRKTEAYLAADDGRWTVRIQNTQDQSEIIVLFPNRRPVAAKRRAAPR